MNCVSLVILLFFKQIKTTYLLKLDAARAFTRATYRIIRSYFTSIEHKKTNQRVAFLTQELSLRIYYSSCFFEFPPHPIACYVPHFRASLRSMKIRTTPLLGRRMFR